MRAMCYTTQPGYLEGQIEPFQLYALLLTEEYTVVYLQQLFCEVRQTAKAMLQLSTQGMMGY